MYNWKKKKSNVTFLILFSLSCSGCIEWLQVLLPSVPCRIDPLPVKHHSWTNVLTHTFQLQPVLGGKYESEVSVQLKSLRSRFSVSLYWVVLLIQPRLVFFLWRDQWWSRLAGSDYRHKCCNWTQHVCFLHTCSDCVCFSNAYGNVYKLRELIHHTAGSCITWT